MRLHAASVRELNAFRLCRLCSRLQLPGMAWEHADTFALLPWLPLADCVCKVALEPTADGSLGIVRVLLVDLERGAFTETLAAPQLAARLHHSSRSTVRAVCLYPLLLVRLWAGMS